MFKLCKNVSITRLQVGRHFCWDVHQSSAAAACVLKDRLINMVEWTSTSKITYLSFTTSPSALAKTVNYLLIVVLEFHDVF